MSKQYRRRNASHTINRFLLAFMSLVIVVAVAAGSIFLIEHFFYDDSKAPVDGNNSVVSSPSSVPNEPLPVTRVSTATVAATGDLLMHLPIISNCEQSDGTYDFNNIFTYFSRYVTDADYAVANLETTLRGDKDGYKYSGYPQFNCPDEMIDASKSAGFDMLLTANNHAYDTRLKGMLRTLDVIDDRGLDRIGTHKDESEKRYIVKDVNGIKIGMLCYTYETDNDKDKVALNGIPMSDEAKPLVNAFSYGELETFYETAAGQIKSMKSEGAEAVILFIHWGEEYSITANKNQKAIAQEMCNLGVDVIIGGHPHVIQPVDLLDSETEPGHKTVCIYSVGNAVSNQRKERSAIPDSGHTEDGALFSVTFAKYSDGTVLLEGAELLPTWVNMYTSRATGKVVYQIIPLDTGIEDWKGKFDLTDTSERAARASYDRTAKIVNSGMEKVTEYLSGNENSYPD